MTNHPKGDRRTVRRVDGSTVDVTVSFENYLGYTAYTDEGELVVAYCDDREAGETRRRFRNNADGTAVCEHRDVSVCPDCATDPTIVEVAGAHYHFPKAADRDELRRLLAAN